MIGLFIIAVLTFWFKLLDSVDPMKAKENLFGLTLCISSLALGTNYGWNSFECPPLFQTNEQFSKLVREWKPSCFC